MSPAKAFFLYIGLVVKLICCMFDQFFMCNVDENYRIETAPLVVFVLIILENFWVSFAGYLASSSILLIVTSNLLIQIQNHSHKGFEVFSSRFW